MKAVKSLSELKQIRQTLKLGLSAITIAKQSIQSKPIIADLIKAEKHLLSLIGELDYRISKRIKNASQEEHKI